MKQQLGVCNEKLAEEGCSLPQCGETKRRMGSREQLIQCLKLILYVELILLFGWGCYTMFQYHRDRTAEVTVEVTDVKRPLELFERQPLESTTNPSAVLSKQLDDIELVLNRLNNLLAVKNPVEEESTGSVGSLETVLGTTQVPESETDVQADAIPEVDENESRSMLSEIASADSSSESYEDTEDVETILDDFGDLGIDKEVITISFPFFGMIHGLLDELESVGNSDEISQSADASVAEGTSREIFSVPAVEVSIAEPEIDPEIESQKDGEVHTRELFVTIFMDPVSGKSESFMSNESENESDSEQETEESFDSEMDSVGNTRSIPEYQSTDSNEHSVWLSGDSGMTETKISAEDFSKESGPTTTGSIVESMFEREPDSTEENSREGLSSDSNVQVRVEDSDSNLATAQPHRTDQDERSTEDQRNEKIWLGSPKAETLEQMEDSMPAEDLLASDLCTQFLRLMEEHAWETKLYNFPRTIEEKQDVLKRCRANSRRLAQSVGSRNEDSDQLKSLEREFP